MTHAMVADELYRNALEHSLEGFQIIGRDWTYLYVNPTAARQGQRAAGELEGWKMTEAYPGIETTPLFAALRRCMEEGVPASMENRFTFADGTARWFELRVEPVPEGVSVHSIDIEERKRLSEDLERRVEARTRELHAANQDLHGFVYSVSHDLRAPLRSIDGFAQALVEDCADRLDGNGLEHLERIRAAAQRMSRLIEALLSLSRVSRTPVERMDVDLSALAEEVAAELCREDPGRRVEWHIAPGLRAACDVGLARVVLENLMGNAWKFTARKPEARIALASVPGHAGAFAVVDDGAGFDTRYASKLFLPFQRLHGVAEFPGTGIGLATVERIVRAHGGGVRADGAVGQGATFTFSFEAPVDG